MYSATGCNVHEYALLFHHGDDKGLAFFFHEFYPPLFYFSHQIIQDRSVAEEIAADAFVKTWRMHAKLNSYGSIRAYLYKVAYNDCLYHLQKEQKRKTAFKQSQKNNGIQQSPVDDIIRAEVHREIYAALKHLSPASRRVIIMYYLEGKTTGQIARELKLHPSTIKTQKTNGLATLRELITKPIGLIVYVFIKIFFPFV